MKFLSRKLITMVCVCVCGILLASITTAQTIVTLRDDSQPNRTLTIDASGRYEFRAAGVGSLLAAGQGSLSRRGCTFSLQDATANFRIAASGDSCNATGKVQLNYFKFGVFTLTDRTKN